MSSRPDGLEKENKHLPLHLVHPGSLLPEALNHSFKVCAGLERSWTGTVAVSHRRDDLLVEDTWPEGDCTGKE